MMQASVRSGTKWVLCLTGVVLSVWSGEHQSSTFSMEVPLPRHKVAVRMHSAPSILQNRPKKVMRVHVDAVVPAVRATTVVASPVELLLPSIAQPQAPSLPTINKDDTLPPVPTGALEPLPPITAPELPDAPGGRVLVLELFLNDEAIVVDARILVPSENALSDLTLNFAVLGQKWTGIDPPLKAGERRRLEMRIPYADATPTVTLP
jgi:hypothetical protein